MNKTLPLILGIAAVAVGGAAAYGVLGPAENPDPNHTHADFAVWVNGTQLDFTDERYMSVAYVEGEPTPRDVNAMRKFLHLHDGNGHVMHSHKPGQSVQDFFRSLGLSMGADCMALDSLQFSLLDQNWLKDFGEPMYELCNNGKFHWTFIVNGTVQSMSQVYYFSDNDKILLSYSASDTAWQELWKQMTDDACLYSRTCPWRGDPPTESCVADPTVPCVQPD